MFQKALVGIIFDLAVLMSLVLLFDAMVLRLRGRSLRDELVMGLGAGLVALTILLNPWEPHHGPMFDALTILFSTVGLFLGAVPTLISLGAAVGLKGALGGACFWPKAGAWGIAAGLGLFWRWLRLPEDISTFSLWELLVFGAVVHIAVFLFMLTRPESATALSFLSFGLFVLVTFPFVTVVVGAGLMRRLQAQSTEEALFLSKEKFRALFEHASFGIVLHDLQSGEISTNPRVQEILGVEELSSPFEQLRELTHPDDFVLDKSLLDELMRGEREWYRMEKRYIRPNREVIWGDLGVSALRDPKGKPLLLMAMVNDITVRKRAQLELLESQERARMIQKVSNVGIWDWNILDGSVFWSEEVERMYGLEVGTFEGSFEAVKSRIHPDDVEPWLASVQQCLKGKAEHLVEMRVLQPDGSYRWVYAYGDVYRDGGEPVRMLGVALDITHRKLQEEEQKKLESQLRQAQKMEAVGQLAGGVAHDFNNILQVMHVHNQFLLDELPEDSALLEYVHEVVRAVERAAGLTHQLLAFSRRQVLERQKFELNGLVSNLINMLRRVLGEDIDLQCHLSSETLGVHADPGQIEQVLMNLCVNARGAMPNGGALIIETTLSKLEEDAATDLLGLEEGSYAVLSVSDTGCGMDEVTQSQIFEPFFTTKEVGEGTGLGLSTAFGIIRQHKGSIQVRSEPGQGATFEVYLPLSFSEKQPHRQKNEQVRSGGGERILLAEDDDVVRQLIAGILRRAGYQVETACDGEEAQATLREHGCSIDLLLSDAVMPKSSGHEVVELFWSIHPEGRVLLMSGYSTLMIDKGLLNGAKGEFLQKPFHPKLLLEKVRGLLDHQSTHASNP